jgi:hypothetical protein
MTTKTVPNQRSEELPWRDRRPDDCDHKQHDFTELPLLGKLRNEHTPSDLTKWWMNHDENWDEHKATGDQRQRETLEPAEVSRADSHDRDCRQGDAQFLRDPEVVQAQHDTDEFGYASRHSGQIGR